MHITRFNVWLPALIFLTIYYVVHCIILLVICDENVDTVGQYVLYLTIFVWSLLVIITLRSTEIIWYEILNLIDSMSLCFNAGFIFAVFGAYVFMTVIQIVDSTNYVEDIGTVNLLSIVYYSMISMMFCHSGCLYYMRSSKKCSISNDVSPIEEQV